MITHVRLINWRAYRTLDIALPLGTTFLVAPNGVGKSTFIEAVRWALDREASPTADVMRRGSKNSTVEIAVAAGDNTVTISRTLTKGRARAPKLETSTSIDGRQVQPNDAFDVLDQAWSASNQFVSRAAFLCERFVDEEPDLRSHLTRVYALDRLQAAIEVLEPALKAANIEADGARKGTAASAQSLEEARGVALGARAAAEGAQARVRHQRTELEVAEAEVTAAKASALQQAARERWHQQHRSLVDDVEDVVGPVLGDVSIQAFVRSAEAGARAQMLERTEERARLQERLAAVEDALTQLTAAGGDCPVCRRPLDDASRAHAEEHHQHERETAAEALDSLNIERPTDLAARLRALVVRADALGDEPAPALQLDLDLATNGHKDAKRQFEDTLSEAARLVQLASDAASEVSELSAQSAEGSAVELYARSAMLDAAIAASRATISEVLNRHLAPLVEEVNRRWEAVFPDRHLLRLNASGSVVRTFDDEHGDLPFTSFSSGERVVSTLMMRLATLTSTTTVPFCWIDEPLEHLDPDARRYVARTMASIGTADSMRQILVTTYEEELALRLVGESSEVHLVFLHTAPTSG